MRNLLLLTLMTLTACGAGGPPVAPTAAQPGLSMPSLSTPGLSMSGSATMGVARDDGT